MTSTLKTKKSIRREPPFYGYKADRFPRIPKKDSLERALLEALLADEEVMFCKPPSDEDDKLIDEGFQNLTRAGWIIEKVGAGVNSTGCIWRLQMRMVPDPIRKALREAA